jgi:UDP-N-acetylglucosamine 2-epimerase (non-hydrolysing)
MKPIDLIAGARPNFMKIAPIIRALRTHQAQGAALAYRLVHTGQHYDARMSGDFFQQLGIPAPDINLEVGSGTQAEQTAAIMLGYERLLLEAPSQLCLVVGDVTSTMACAIAAQKLHIPVAHVEGGIRSGDWGMPEEINRMVTDAITNYFFTTSEVANANLRRAGVEDERIFFVGNTMIDTLLHNLPRLRPPAFWADMALSANDYFVLTLHRPANVDQGDGFVQLLNAIGAGTRGLPVIFPVHPRTAKTLQALNDLPNNIHLVDPQPYLEFNYLVKHAKAVITDSGGITEETTVLGVPCMTLRDSTERPETMTIGTNELLGTDPAALSPALDRLFAGQWKQGGIPEKWDGKTGERIVNILADIIGKEPKDRVPPETDFIKQLTRHPRHLDESVEFLSRDQANER